MDSRSELLELIGQLPEEKVATALTLLKELIGKQESSEKIVDPLQDLMKALMYAMNNSLYDLSIDAGRKEEKVLSNRLESYRKRVAEAWEMYKAKNDIN
jgi:intein/homing endonuclease